MNIPALTDASWRRLEQEEGSRSDLESVLTFLARMWAFEPDAFDRWLAERYQVERKKLPPSMLAEYRKRYEVEQEFKLKRTRDLLERIAHGPYLLPLIEHANAFSDELKAVVFEIALAIPHSEHFVFVLSALSLQRPTFVREFSRNLPASPIVQTFLAYIGKSRLPLALDPSLRPLQITPQATNLDRLFDVANRPLHDLIAEVRNIPEPDRLALVTLAGGLFQQLSETRVFEAFVRLNLAVFICAAAEPDDNLIPSAVKTLAATADPGVAQILALLGEGRLLNELQDPSNLQPGRERFLASIIDALRTRFPEALPKLKKDLEKASSTQKPVLEVAVSAALLQNSPAQTTKFEKLLLKKLQHDKERYVREWTLRNPEFARYLRAEKASVATLRDILDESKQKQPELALKIVEQVLREPLGAGGEQHCEEAFRALVSIESDKSDALFLEFMSRQLDNGWSDPRVRQVLASDSARALLRRGFWQLLDAANTDENRGVLFDLYASRASESDLTRLVDQAYLREPGLSRWITEGLVPRLVENRSLSPAFPQYSTSLQFLKATAQSLGRSAVETTLFLRRVADQWDSTRTAAKRKILPAIQSAVQIAIQNSLSGSTLRSQIERLAKNIEVWTDSSLPKLESAVSAYALTPIPPECACDRGRLEQFFRERPRGPNDFALFVGANPWAIDLIVADDHGPWPKTEILIAQLVKTFLFIIQLRRTAETQVGAIDHHVRVELATSIREDLAEIESDLAGYFVFRDIIDGVGLHPVMPKLGGRVDDRELSSQRHKVIRDPNRRGLLRTFGLGIRIDEFIVSSGTVMKSGGDDDRD